MPLIPSLGGVVPGTPVSYSLPNEVIPPQESPLVYTTAGPLDTLNGIAFTEQGLVFDPNAVTEGDLDCGTFGN